MTLNPALSYFRYGSVAIPGAATMLVFPFVFARASR